MSRASPETVADSMLRAHVAGFRVNATSGRNIEDFARVLLECVDRTFEDLVGSKVRDAAYQVLEKDYIAREDIPDKPDVFASFLEETFGVAGKTIGRAIARSLYHRLGLNFMNNPEYGFIEYVREAKP